MAWFTGVGGSLALVVAGACVGWVIGRSMSGPTTVPATSAPAASPGNEIEASQPKATGRHKMVFLVRTDLRMGKGKAAAQCCHAVVGCYKRAMKRCPAAVKTWHALGAMKVTLKCPDEETMDSVEAEAKRAGFCTFVVADAGHTQVDAGSRTVLAIGPAPVGAMDALTGHLKLY